MKRLIIFCLVLACILGLVGCGVNNTIGKIGGAENEYITIGDVTYERDFSSNFSYKDRDDYLGQVTNGKITMKVYSVDSDADGMYIYARWEWEGAFYIRQDHMRTE